MGLFSSKNTSAYDFEQKLKSDADFMLKVLNIVEKNPSIAELQAGVKNLGFKLEAMEILEALKNAVEHYKSLMGGNGGGSSSSGSGKSSLAGFSQ